MPSSGVADAEQQAQSLASLREQLEWKIEEISALKLAPGEWESLSEEQKRLAHAAELLQASQSALQSIAEEDPSILTQVEKMNLRLTGLIDKDPRLAPAASALETAAIGLREAADAMRRYLDRSDLDPQRLAEVEERVPRAHDDTIEQGSRRHQPRDQ